VALLAALFIGALPANAQQRPAFPRRDTASPGAAMQQQNGGLPVFGCPLTKG
jgi:hypothetical protein